MKRLGTCFALLMAGILLLSAALYALRSVLIAPRLVELIQQRVRKELGLELSIGALSGSYLTGLEISDVRTVQPSQTGPVAALDLKTFSLRYSLFSLLNGVDEFIAGTTLDVDSLRLAVDLTRGAAAARAAPPAASPQRLPAALPAVRLRNASLALTGNGFTTELNGVSLEAALSPGQPASLALSVTSLHAARSAEGTANPASSLTGRLDLTAEAAWPIERMQTAAGRLNLTFNGQGPADAQPIALQAEAALASGQLALGRLDLNAAGSRMVITRAGVPWAALAGGDAWGLLRELSGVFSVSSEDIPRLLKTIGVTPEPGGVQLPGHRLVLEGRLDAGTLTLSQGNLTAGESSIRIGQLKATLDPHAASSPLTAELSIDVPDLASVAALFSTPPLMGSVRANVSLDGTIGDPHGRAEVSAEGLAVEGFPLGALSLKAAAGEQQIRVESLTLTQAGDRLAARGLIRLPGGRIEDAALDFSIAEIERYSERLIPAAATVGGKPLSIQGALRGTAVLRGAWNDPDGDLNAECIDLRLNGQPFGNGSARIGKQGRSITAWPIEFVNGSDRFFLQGEADPAKARFGATRLEVDAADIAPYLAVFGVDALRLSGRTSVRLEGSGPLAAPDARLELSVGRAQAGGTVLAGTHIRAQSSGDTIRFESAETLTPLGALRLAGSLLRGPADRVLSATVTQFEVEGEPLTLGLDHPAALRYDRPGVITVDGLDCSGPQGRISVQGRLALKGSSDLTVNLSGVTGRGWLAKLTGRPIGLEGLDATLRASGSPAAPQISAAGSIRKIGAQDGGPSFAGRFELTYAEKRLEIASLELNGPEGHHIELSGSVPVDAAKGFALEPGELSLSALARIPDLTALRSLLPSLPVASGAADMQLSLAGSWRDPNGTLRLNGRNLMPEDAAGPLPPGPYSLTGEASLRAERLTLQRFIITGHHATASAEGTLSGLPSLPRLAAGALDTGNAQLSLRARIAAPDLGFLKDRLEGLRRTAGRLEAQVEVAGPLARPDLRAEIQLTDGEIRPTADVPSVQDIQLQAVLTSDQVRISRATGQLGGAPFELSGTLAWSGGSGAAGESDLALKGHNLLFFRSESMLLRADTDLRLRGPFSRMELEGEVNITEGYFEKNFSLLQKLTTRSAAATSVKGIELFSIESEPFRSTVLDVHIASAKPFRVRNNLVKGALRPDLRLTGTGLVPVLTGTVYLEPTTVNLPAGRMQFESGLIRFEAGKPNYPQLAMNGESHMLGYEIKAAVEGPYDEPVVTLSSVPPLSDEDLLMLVLTGQAPPKTGGRSSDRADQRRDLNVAVFIGKDLLTSLEGNGPNDTTQSILDRFDVEIGRYITRKGDETVNAQFRLADGVIQKEDSVYVTGEKDVYDFYNAGVKIVFRFR